MNIILINEKIFNLKATLPEKHWLKKCYFKNKFHFDFKKVDVILTWKPIPKQRNYWYLYRYKTILASFEICIIHKKGLVFFYEYSTSQIVLLQTYTKSIYFLHYWDSCNSKAPSTNWNGNKRFHLNILYTIKYIQQNSNITNMDISNLRLIYVSATLLFKPIYNYRI